ncbi:unnamed protein product [Angiostrongylus costaricensis]|uniref:Uncharacterized protein n=1 Tax=Angiostrongylus costaricensis TaxID=334426 RepID=A0A0R3PCZ8_ANGCS|nr:unnamed protein product [Angiostrongylus costaricensis]
MWFIYETAMSTLKLILNKAYYKNRSTNDTHPQCTRTAAAVTANDASQFCGRALAPILLIEDSFLTHRILSRSYWITVIHSSYSLKRSSLEILKYTEID